MLVLLFFLHFKFPKNGLCYFPVTRRTVTKSHIASKTEPIIYACWMVSLVDIGSTHSFSYGNLMHILENKCILSQINLIFQNILPLIR